MPINTTLKAVETADVEILEGQGHWNNIPFRVISLIPLRKQVWAQLPRVKSPKSQLGPQPALDAQVSTVAWNPSRSEVFAGSGQ